MGVVYIIYFELRHWMAEVEFLVKFDVFVHIHCFLYHNILLHDVLLVGNSISKMFKLVHPWQLVPTQHHIDLHSWFPHKCNTLSFTLLWVDIGTELKIVFGCKIFTNFKHFLESKFTWSKQEIIIRISKNPDKSY